MFARGTMPPPLVLFEENATWRTATPVLGAINRPFTTPVDFKVSNQYKAGFHLSTDIPAVDVSENQRLVFLKYYGPNFGLQYVGAMYIGCLQDVIKGYKGISAAMQARFGIPLPDNVDFYRLLGPDRVELIDMSPQPIEGPPLPVPEHGEIIVLQSTNIEPECCFSKKFSTFPRFSIPEPVPRTLSFGEKLLQDAESGFMGVDVKFIGGPEDKKFTLTAHRSALCTTEYFRRLFTRESPPPPCADKDGFYLITPPGFANETTMKHFIGWIYTRHVNKELRLDVALCLNLSITHSNSSKYLVRLGDYCVCESLVRDCVEVIGRVKSFDIATALDALDLAEKLADAEAATLRRRAMQYIVAHFDEVAAAERFHKLVGTAVYYSIIAAVYQVVKATL
jgi:hypothetical protein